MLKAILGHELLGEGVLTVCAVIAIWRGPDYIRSIGQFWNERRRINGKLKAQRDKLELDAAKKRTKLASQPRTRKTGGKT